MIRASLHKPLNRHGIHIESKKEAFFFFLISKDHPEIISYWKKYSCGREMDSVFHHNKKCWEQTGGTC